MTFKNGMRPVHPGEVLREEYLKPLDLSANALAKALRLSPSRIGGIVLERRGVTADTAVRIARVRNLGRALFTTDEAVSEWLSKAEQTLGNIAPLNLLDTDFGAREVENLLRALAYGHFV